MGSALSVTEVVELNLTEVVDDVVVDHVLPFLDEDTKDAAAESVVAPKPPPIPPLPADVPYPDKLVAFNIIRDMAIDNGLNGSRHVMPRIRCIEMVRSFGSMIVNSGSE